MPDFVLEPWCKTDDAEREVRAVTNAKDIAHNVARIRSLTDGIREGRRMSLLGKLQHLTEEAQGFDKETGDVLDGIAEKIALGRRKRDAAKEKHHAYYDGIIRGIDQSTEVIERLSNGPLSGDGKA